jgi:hypothetical protein
VFSPGVIDLLPEAIWDRPLLIWSAPGFGKTSLMNAFDAAVMRIVASRRGQSSRYKDLAEYLERVGALGERPLVVGFRIPLRRDFRAIPDLGAPEQVSLRLFNRLLDARIASGYISALLALEGLNYPGDAASVELRAKAGQEDALARLGGSSGADLLIQADGATSEIRDLLDALMPPAYEGIAGHARLYSLDVLSTTKAIVDGREVEARPLVMFDDGQDLTSSQRAHLLESLRDRDLDHARWYAERYTALDPHQVVSDEESESRTITTVRLEQASREGSADQVRTSNVSRRFENLLLNVADRRAADPLRIYDDEQRSFTVLVDAGEEHSIPGPSDTIATEAARLRALALAREAERYQQWIKLAESKASETGALAWRELEILLERDRGRAQGELFEQVLGEEDWEARSSSAIREAARLFLARELRLPFYYGERTLARLGSNNIEQFVRLSGDLFEEMLTLITLNRPPQLEPLRQHRLILAASEHLWKTIPTHFDRGREIQRLLFAIARMAHRATYRSTAPYPPGPNATAINMTDRDRLGNVVRRKQIPGAEEFLPVLAGAIANNLLYAELDRSVKGGRWMVLYLNRLLLPRFQLPLAHGNFREQTLETLIGWCSGVDDADEGQGDLQLPLPVTLQELQL